MPFRRFLALLAAAIAFPQPAHSQPLNYWGGSFGGAMVVPVFVEDLLLTGHTYVAKDTRDTIQAAIGRMLMDANTYYLHEEDQNGYSAATGSWVVAPVNVADHLPECMGDGDIADELSRNFAPGMPLANYAPTGDGLGIIYGVYLPVGTLKCGGGGRHASGVYQGTPFRFYYLSGGDGPGTRVGCDATTYHELVETMTDPWSIITSPPVGANPPYTLAWNQFSYAQQQQNGAYCEIADMCNSLSTVLGGDGQRTQVGKMWSPGFGACVTGQRGSPISGVSQAPNSLSGYWTRMDGSIAYSYNLNGGPWTYEVVISGTTPGNCNTFQTDGCPTSNQNCFDGPLTPVSTFSDQRVKVFGASPTGGISEVRWDGQWSAINSLYANGDTPSYTRITAVNSGLGDGSVWVVWPTYTGAIKAMFLPYDDSSPTIHTIGGNNVGLNPTSVAAVVTKPGNLWLFWIDESGSISANGFDCTASSCNAIAGPGHWNGTQSGLGNANPGTPLSSMDVNGVTWIISNNSGSIVAFSITPALGTLSPSAQSAIYGPGSAGGGPWANPGTPIAAVAFGDRGALFWPGSDGTIQRGTLNAHGAWSAAAALPIGSTAAGANTVVTATATGATSGSVMYTDVLGLGAVMLTSPTIFGSPSSYQLQSLSITTAGGPVP